MAIVNKVGSYPLDGPEVLEGEGKRSRVFKFPQQGKQCPERSTKFHLMKGGGRCIQGRGENTGECADATTCVPRGRNEMSPQREGREGESD